MSSKPSSPTAEFLTRAIEDSGVTHTEIADRAGFGAPNVISMMRLGRMKVPIDRIPDIAAACGVDDRRFLRIALAEYHPEVWEVLKSSFGDVLTRAEQDLLAVYRLLDPDQEATIDASFCEALVADISLEEEDTPVSHPLGPTGRPKRNRK